MKRSFKPLRYAFEGILAWTFYWVFWTLGADAASAAGGFIGRHLGPRLKVHRVAQRNIAAALPELPEPERERILLQMWDNLGRVAAEAPHIPALAGKRLTARVEVMGTEHLVAAKEQGKAIIFSGHFANWEIAPRAAYELGLPLVLMYRMANNPWVERLYRFTRRKSHIGLYAKGKDAAVEGVRALKDGRPLGMLVDQKMNEGIPVPFFGRDAMTAPAMASLAIKYKVPLYPTQVVRTHGAHFRVFVNPPMDIAGKDEAAIMAEVNALFERWIRQHPGQWMWVHNRWPSEK